MKPHLFGFSSAVFLAAAASASAATYQPGYSQTWLTQIKLPSNVWAGTSGGAGVVIGIVDTGIDASNAELVGRVLPQSSCAAVSFRCSNGVFDDQGHGTAVASIAAGASVTNTVLMSGVAPGVSIVAEKVLNSSGSGTDADVANGLTLASDAGAKVINLSLTYIPTARIVAAINYAAAKGATVVFAGGNDGKAINGGASTTGLTALALSHLVFVGSVNSANVKSSFSNTPGSGFASNTATLNATYASLWLMAPGESIVAPGIQYGKTAYAYWTGTSMAAPVVTGALALLEKTWPVLYRNGTATAVLFASSTDLGAAGVDSTYGRGLLNLTAAFQPIGSISAVGPTGQTIPLGSSTAAIVSSQTLGTLKGLSTALANYTVFDGYSRNFTANLSSLLGKPATQPVSLSSMVYSPIWTNVAKLANGGVMEMIRDRSGRAGDPAPQGPWFGQSGEARRNPSGFVAYSSPGGVVVAGGFGFAPQAAFGRALFGGAGVEGQAETGASNALAAMAQGGYAGTLGAPLGRRLRLAASWSSTGHDPEVAAPTAAASRQAELQSVGVAYAVTDRLTLAATVSALHERNGLLGAAYTRLSAVNLGDRHQSVSSGVTAAIRLGPHDSLTLDVAEAHTDAAAVSGGLIARVGSLKAAAFGASYARTDLFARGDSLSITVRQPLQLVSGAADLAVTTVDEEGYNHTGLARTDLAGGVRQVDFGLGYARMFGASTQIKADLVWRNNLYGVAGREDAGVRFLIQNRF